MRELSRYLFLVGALPFVFLGVAHALGTPLTTAQSKGLSPRDPALRETMTTATVLITRRTTLWLTWVGFNLSHSLGLLLLGTVVLLVGRSQASFQTQAGLFLPVASVVSGLYLLLAIRYWFRTPVVCIATALACFVASWVLFLVGG
jgi:hypothetical protein